MANNFRELAPVRTYTKSHNNYRQYKDPLAEDFNRRCGYTDCPDSWFGGKDHFHIDHFIPWKKYPAKPDLKTTYSNLVYSCSYVNILKSDDEGNYLDPCEVEYNDHFTRDYEGAILPNQHSEKAKYMYNRLKLYLIRYKTIWMLDQLETRMNQLIAVVNSGCLDSDQKAKAKLCVYDLVENYLEYKKYLQG